MRGIDVVFAARVFLQLFVWCAEHPRSRVRERPRVELRILDQGLDVNVVVVRPGPPLDDV